MLFFSGASADDKTGQTTAPEPQVSGEQTAKNTYINEMQQRLSGMLEQISGVGEVEVMLTISASAQTVVASDEKYSENITQNSDGSTKTQQTNKDVKVTTLRDQPLVLQEIEPKIEGVVVVASGANSTKIVLDITQAVVALTGVKSHKVAVFSKKIN
ncbi:MAG: hypothetical protein LBL34_06205 [Clostridiales bacterium]|nr:hypothetical protein [Clostridiales bacterium]